MRLSTFLDFWLSDAHEREITSGNLPLSEDVSEEYSGERASGGRAHASRAGGTVADIQDFTRFGEMVPLGHLGHLRDPKNNCEDEKTLNLANEHTCCGLE